MQTTITLNAATYNKAKACADERHMTIDEFLVMLINTMPNESEADNRLYDNMPVGTLFCPSEHSQDELEARFDEIEKELDADEGITHEQMMAELKQEFSKSSTDTIPLRTLCA